MDVTIRMPDDLVREIAALPEAERSRYTAAALAGPLSHALSEAIAEALIQADLEANTLSEADEYAEACEGIAEGIADMEAGRTLALEEERARWRANKETLLSKAKSLR